MTQTLYIPSDTSAAALGADSLATTLLRECEQRGLEVDLRRNGSRGLFWLEPLLELYSPLGRVALGPMTVTDVEELLRLGFAGIQQHSKYLGPVATIPYLQQQTRLTFARAGLIRPLSLDDYQRHDGWQGLKQALTMKPRDIVETVKASGLRGRGGAAFPTGIKWETVLGADGEQKYIICNADEGDSGTFADRLLMEADPFQLIEGMIIAGLAVGAEQGYIYLRSEYPRAHRVMTEAIRLARQAEYLGDSVCGSGIAFDIELRLGAGAYICGEETSLLDSLEGKRGLVRYKPPLPAIKGFFGQPTVVNNVLSLAAASTILAQGAEAYQDLGSGRSRGTLTIQLAGNIQRGGLIEVPFGLSLRTILEDFGGGSASGRPIKTVQVGGPLGSYLPESSWDTPMDYEALADVGGMLGHGGVVVFDDSVDMARQARFAMEFCAVESCGKCTPCRIGSVRGVEVIDKIINNKDREDNLVLLEDLCETMEEGSLCAMGGLTPMPVRSALQHYREDFYP